MRIEIAGAQITDAVVEVLDTLQNQQELTRLYLETLDAVTRSVILNISGDEAEDSATLSRLRALQMIRRDLLSLAMPPNITPRLRLRRRGRFCVRRLCPAIKMHCKDEIFTKIFC